MAARSRSRSPKRVGSFREIYDQVYRALSTPWPSGASSASTSLAHVVEPTAQENEVGGQWPIIPSEYVPVVRDASQETWTSTRTGVQEDWAYGWDHFLMMRTEEFIWHREVSRLHPETAERWTKWKRYVYADQVAEDASHGPAPAVAYRLVMEDAFSLAPGQWGESSDGTEGEIFIRG